MRVHWGWVIIGAVAGAVIWPKVAPKLTGAAKKGYQPVGAVAFVLLWMGYSTAYYGYNRITGGNDSFKSLVWPGAYTHVARDSGQ